MTGLINLDKPPGISSARAVSRVKRLLPSGVRIGHAGTLDPFATGVLLLLLGRATKLAESLMDRPKQYDATLRFGATTPTDDPDSPTCPWPSPVQPTLAAIEQTLPRFVGVISQRPPAFSALKIAGRRAYDLARRGLDPPLAARPVQVYAIALISYDWPTLRLRIDCGRGTYIRSLARDLGNALNVGAYLTALRRTKIGPFTVADAVTVDRLTLDGVAPHLISVEALSPQP